MNYNALSAKSPSGFYKPTPTVPPRFRQPSTVSSNQQQWQPPSALQAQHLTTSHNPYQNQRPTATQYNSGRFDSESVPNQQERPSGFSTPVRRSPTSSSYDFQLPLPRTPDRYTNAANMSTRMSPHKANYQFNDNDQYDADVARDDSNSNPNRDQFWDDRYRFQAQNGYQPEDQYNQNEQQQFPSQHNPPNHNNNHNHNRFQTSQRFDRSHNFMNDGAEYDMAAHNHNKNHPTGVTSDSTRWAPLPSLSTTSPPHRHHHHSNGSFTHQPSPTLPQSRHHSTQQHNQSSQASSSSSSSFQETPTSAPTPSLLSPSHRHQHQHQHQSPSQSQSPYPSAPPSSISSSLTIVSVDGIKPGIILTNPLTYPLVVSLCSSAAAANATAANPHSQTAPSSPSLTTPQKNFLDPVNGQHSQNQPLQNQTNNPNPTPTTTSQPPHSNSLQPGPSPSFSPSSQPSRYYTNNTNPNSPNPFHVSPRGPQPQPQPHQQPQPRSQPQPHSQPHPQSQSQSQLQSQPNSALSSPSSFSRHNPFPAANLKLSLRPFDNIVLNTYHSRNLDPMRRLERKLFIYTQPALTHNEFCEALVSIILVETPTTELAKLSSQEQLAIFPNQRRYSVIKPDNNNNSASTSTGTGSTFTGTSSQTQPTQERIHFGICPCLINNPKIEFKLLPTPVMHSNSTRIPPNPNPLDPHLTSSVFYINCSLLLSDLYPDLAVTNQCTSFASPHRRLVSFAHNLVHDPLSLAWAMMRAIQSRAQSKITMQVHIDELLPNAP